MAHIIQKAFFSNDQATQYITAICEMGTYKSYNMRFSSIIRHYQVNLLTRPDPSHDISNNLPTRPHSAREILITTWHDPRVGS